MKRLIQFVKSLRLKQMFTIFLAGSLLVISTACSQGKVASTTNQVKRELSDTYDKYDATQPPQGGMNGYNDDPRYDNPEMQAKVKALVDQAKAKSNSYNSVGEYVEGVTDKAGKNLNQAKKDITKDVQQKTRSLQDNIGEATNNLQDAAKSTAKDIKNKVQDLT